MRRPYSIPLTTIHDYRYFQQPEDLQEFTKWNEANALANLTQYFINYCPPLSAFSPEAMSRALSTVNEANHEATHFHALLRNVRWDFLLEDDHHCAGYMRRSDRLWLIGRLTVLVDWFLTCVLPCQNAVAFFDGPDGDAAALTDFDGAPRLRLAIDRFQIGTNSDERQAYWKSFLRRMDEAADSGNSLPRAPWAVAFDAERTRRQALHQKCDNLVEALVTLKNAIGASKNQGLINVFNNLEPTLEQL